VWLDGGARDAHGGDDGAVRLFSLQESLDMAILTPVDAVLTLCHAITVSGATGRAAVRNCDGELLDEPSGKVRTH
jgi:hypothetical protein